MKKKQIFALLLPLVTAACALAQKPERDPNTNPAQDEQLQKFNVMVNEARLRKLGVEPGSKKAKIVLSYMQQEQSDPDIQRMLATLRNRRIDPMNPLVQRSVNADGLLRLSPSDRDLYLQRVLFIALNEVPADCDGIAPAVSISKHDSFEHAPADLVERNMDLNLRTLRAAATATNAIATITPQQRQLATAAIGKQVIDDLHDDQDATRKLANYIADRAGASPELQCWATKRSFAAVTHLPQPLRDYAAIDMLTRIHIPSVTAVTSGAPTVFPPPVKSPNANSGVSL